ncbi:MAG: response regulator [Myxococcota bacterium]
MNDTLLVDDDPDFLAQMARAFRRRGFAVRTAQSATAAIEQTADRIPDRAVVDLRLGRDHGLEVVQALLRIDDRIRVVVLTAYGSIATATRAIRLGAVDYVTKPAHLDDLLAAFEAAERPADAAEPLRDDPATLAEAEWEYIQRILAECDGNITRTAEILGIHRRSLQRKLGRGPGG